MAKAAIYAGQLTSEMMNGSESYRVKFSYGVFSIAAKVTQGGRCYWYVYKRYAGRLYKGYVGKQGEVDRWLLAAAASALLGRIRAETGAIFARDNRARKVTQRANARLIALVAARLVEINGRAARCAAGEIVTMAGYVVTCERIEPGMVEMNELIDDAARELGGEVIEFYMGLPDDAYYRMEREIAVAVTLAG